MSWNKHLCSLAPILPQVKFLEVELLSQSVWTFKTWSILFDLLLKKIRLDYTNLNPTNRWQAPWLPHMLTEHNNAIHLCRSAPVISNGLGLSYLLTRIALIMLIWDGSLNQTSVYLSEWVSSREQLRIGLPSWIFEAF